MGASLLNPPCYGDNVAESMTVIAWFAQQGQ